MKNNRVRMLTASALVLALTLSAGAWRYDDSVYASGGASLSASADPNAGGNDEGHNKRERESGGHGAFRLFTDERVAAVLGLTADELSSGLKADKSLAELAQERGADVTAVKLVIEAALKEKLDAKLAAGKLTQEQYDKQAERLADFAAVLLNSKHGGSRDASRAELKAERSAERESAKAERRSGHGTDRGADKAERRVEHSAERGSARAERQSEA